MIIHILEEIFKILRTDCGIVVPSSILTLSKDSIHTSIGNIYPYIKQCRSPLQDSLIPLSYIVNMCTKLHTNKSLVRINHIGFLYTTKNTSLEIERIQKEVQKAHTHLYKEESNDGHTWLFIGDALCLEQPLLEIILVEKTNDKWRDYWIPHIQIDLDTTLSALEIHKLLKQTLPHTIQPLDIVIDNITYIVRSRIGVIDGININIDLATAARNVPYHRKHILQLLI